VTTIYLNGEERELEGTPTVADVARLFPVTKGVAVARNGEVVPRSAWEVTAIEPSDRFEVLSVAPGG
jgi:sulfur carrier protein